jgi:hypothetical protein
MKRMVLKQAGKVSLLELTGKHGEHSYAVEFPDKFVPSKMVMFLSLKLSESEEEYQRFVKFFGSLN